MKPSGKFVTADLPVFGQGGLARCSVDVPCVFLLCSLWYTDPQH